MNQTLTLSNSPVVILHLSDLHFDGDEDGQSASERKVVFGALIEEIKALDDEWRPTVVCITGDMACENKQSGYTEAAEWLETLLQELSIEKEGLFVCPGNHDVDQGQASFLVRPHNPVEADRVLRLPIADHDRSLFDRYIDFCQKLELHPYSFNGTQEFIIGSRSYKDTNFVCNNSCWCSMDGDDKGSLWLGQQFIRSLELPLISSPEFPITIALMHHPKEYYKEDEIYSFAERASTIDYLASRCHIILTGHVHGRPRHIDTIHDAIIFYGGCYSSRQHCNSYSLIQLWPDELSISYRQYEWNGRLSSWDMVSDEYKKLCIKEKYDNAELARKVQQDSKPKIQRQYSREEIEKIYNDIHRYVNSLDFPEAIKVYEDKRDVLAFHKDKYEDLIMKIEILFDEAKDE